MLTPWKESYDQPRQHIKKQRHYFADNGPSSQGYGFSSSHIWMWELYCKESWALKNWCFWTVVLEKTLESPLDCKRSSQSILKGISPECSLEGLMLKLELQYFGHLMQRADSFGKTVLLGKVEGRRRRGWQSDGWMASLTQWTWVWVNSVSWLWTERPGVLQSKGSQRVRHDWVIELNWTDRLLTLLWIFIFCSFSSFPPLSSLPSFYSLPSSQLLSPSFLSFPRPTPLILLLI